VTELSPNAAAFIRACRSAIEPTLSEQERCAAALRMRLGDAALSLANDFTSSGVLRTGWAKASIFAVALGVVSSLTLLAWQRPSLLLSTAPKQRIVTVAPARPAADSVQLEQPSAPAASAPSAPPEPVAPSLPRPPADHLGQEVAIMSRATSDLHAGRAASALEAIAEHQRKFPNGVLAEERRAARVQALCALGRRNEAEAELELLLRRAPRSPTTLRAAEVCGITPPSQ